MCPILQFNQTWNISIIAILWFYMPANSEAPVTEMRFLRSIVWNFALCLTGFRSVKLKVRSCILTTFSKNCNGYFLRGYFNPWNRFKQKNRHLVLCKCLRPLEAFMKYRLRRHLSNSLSASWCLNYHSTTSHEIDILFKI